MSRNKNTDFACHKVQRPSSHRYLFISIALTILCVAGACKRTPQSNNQGATSSQTPIASGPPTTAFPMPPLSGRSLGSLGWATSDGKRTLFGNFKGKVLVLDFYATWCMPCKNSIPHLIELQNRYGQQGLQVIGLNVGGPDDLDHVNQFATELGIQYPLAVPDNDLSNFLLSDNTDIPQTFVFDRNGRLVRRFIGYGEDTGQKIDESVEFALQTKTE